MLDRREGAGVLTACSAATPVQEAVILTGKRHRAQVDYLKLSQVSVCPPDNG